MAVITENALFSFLQVLIKLQLLFNNLILAITETFQFTTQLLRFYDDFMFLHSFHHLDTAATLIDDAFTGSFIFKNNQRPLQHQQQTWQQHT